MDQFFKYKYDDLFNPVLNALHKLGGSGALPGQLYTINMSDVHDIRTRSFNMSRIRSKNTKPEMYVRKFLYKNGFRYRLHYSKLPGKPDVVLVGKRIVIDIKGCYWHRHEGCQYAATPNTNKEFYQKKFTDTIARDAKNRKQWQKEGWKVVDVWECELKNSEKRERRLLKLINELT